tara:strand:- start:471 stop:797 length:327 start_codon:yes stop_codon:yes gene_type:complete
MAKLLEAFLEQLVNEGSTIDIKSELSSKELLNWETLVKIFDEMDMENIALSVEKVNQRYKLERWQEISVLAYIKLLEIMVARMQGMQGALSKLDKVSGSEPYDGSMFG